MVDVEVTRVAVAETNLVCVRLDCVVMRVCEGISCDVLVESVVCEKVDEARMVDAEVTRVAVADVMRVCEGISCDVLVENVVCEHV